MSYTRLFELATLDLSSSNIGKLFERLSNVNMGNYITKDEISKTISQKKLLNDVLDFLLEKKILELVEDGQEKIYKVLVSFPKTHNEKELELFNRKKLYLSQKELITKKLQSYVKKTGYIVKLDLANSTSEKGDIRLKDSLLNIQFPEFVKKSCERYFYANRGYVVAQYGDEAFLFFFEERDLINYVNDMLKLYSDKLEKEFTIYNINAEYNDKLYLKIFIANSTISNITYDSHNMPGFENMVAMKYISRVEKPFKEQILKKKNIEIGNFFIVADQKLDDEFIFVNIESEDKTTYKVFYKIDNVIKR